MKKIKAYRCEYCKKILQSYSGMYKHEKACFYNKESRSCATCKYLQEDLFFKGKRMTNNEYLIFSFRIKETFHLEPYGDVNGVLGESKVLNDEYKYLCDYEPGHLCEVFNSEIKLKTKCIYHKI